MPDADVSFREQGYLILASADGVRVLEENHRIQVENGADNVLLDAAGLKRQFPWMETDGLALGCFGRTGEGWLDPYSLMTLLRKGGGGEGRKHHSGRGGAIEIAGDRVKVLRLASGENVSPAASWSMRRVPARRARAAGRHRTAGRPAQALCLCARLPGGDRGTAQGAL